MAQRQFADLVFGIEAGAPIDLACDLDDFTVEQRHAHFQRMKHAAAIDLEQDHDEMAGKVVPTKPLGDSIWILICVIE